MTTRLHAVASAVILMAAVCAAPAVAQQPFWESTAGPNGRSITALAVDARGVLYAGTNGTGAFRSTDGGAHWLAANGALGGVNARIAALACDETNRVYMVRNRSIYRSDDEGGTWTPHELICGPEDVAESFLFLPGSEYISVWGKGVFRSTDNGATWGQVNNGLGYGFGSLPKFIGIRALAADGAGRIYAADSSFVWRSTDGGAQWTRPDTNDFNGAVRAMLVTAGGAILIAIDQLVSSIVYRSSDAGMSWTMVLGVLGSTPTIARASTGTLFCSTSGGIYTSADDGITWTGKTARGASTFSSLLATGHDSLLAGGLTGLASSFDGGASWLPRDVGLFASGIVSLAYDGAQDVYTLIPGLGVMKYDLADGRWSRTGIPGTTFVLADSSGLIMTDVAVSQDSGATWKFHNFYSSAPTGVLMGPGSAIFGAVSGAFSGTDGLMQTTDAGMTWTRIAGFPSVPIRILTRSTAGHLLVASKKIGFGISTDNGVSWRIDSSALSPFRGHDATALFETRTGTLLGMTDVYVRSSDEGATWDTVESPPHFTLPIMIVQTSSGTLYCATGTQLFRSFDDGWNWFEVTGATVCSEVEGMILVNSHLWVATDSCGVQRSANAVQESERVDLPHSRE